MYEEIVKEAYQAVVKKDWSTFKRYIVEDCTWKLVGAGLTISYAEFFSIVESFKILNPEDEDRIIKVIGINDYVICILEQTHVENGITERQINHEVIKMDGNKMKGIVVYNSHVPDFEYTEKWLNSLNVEYERQSI
jgi:hypothetical protein